MGFQTGLLKAEALIDPRPLKISWSAQQRVLQQPSSDGDVFKSIKYDKWQLKSCDNVLVYAADPSTSNKRPRA
jgi:hypothetical protein